MKLKYFVGAICVVFVAVVMQGGLYLLNSEEIEKAQYGRRYPNEHIPF